MSCNVNEVFSYIENNQKQYIDFLADICNIETPSHDKAALDELVGFIDGVALSLGFETERIPFDSCGDFLLIELNKGNEKGCFFMAHMDTVHEKGKFGYPPARISGGRMTGPGVIDCKGGIAVALLAMKSLKENGYKKHLRLLLTSDEEISNSLGGEKELELIKNSAKGFPCALNCEVGRPGKLVTARSGILRAEISVVGKPAHSGIAYFSGVSAVKEAAHKIIELESKSVEGGTTYNCAIISGGDKFNIVPEKCSVFIDVRVKDMSEMEKAQRLLQDVTDTSYVKGSSASLTVISRRLPMTDNSDTMRLFDRMNKVSEKYALGRLQAVRSGGGADSAYTQAAGVASICAVGLCGELCHTENEYALICSLCERAKLIGAFCAEDE